MALSNTDTERTDILGAGWTARTIALRPDEEGPVVATLVYRSERRVQPRAVLYVHGFVDYFFQTHLAQEWIARDFDFYALDLRKYGRSLRPHQTPNFITDLGRYHEELDAAAGLLREDFGHHILVVMGHSTGGLLTSLWTHARRGRGIVDALVLNSPWFDLNGNWLENTVRTRIVAPLGRIAPRRTVGALDPWYGRSLHRQAEGVWDYDLSLKPIEGFPVRAGWLRAIRRGHARLAKGLSIDCPVLVCCASASGPPDRWHDAIHRTDSVLDVADIVRRSGCLGNLVTIARIPDGIHDLSLSPEPARRLFFEAIFRWTQAYVPPSSGWQAGSLEGGAG